MRICWFIDKQFDTALEVGAWLEIVKHLQRDNDIHLAAGYQKNTPQFGVLKNEVIYISSSRIPFLTRMMFYYNQRKIFSKIIERLHPDTLIFTTNNPTLLRKASLLRKKYGYRTFLSVRSLPVYSSKIKNFLESQLFRECLRIASRLFDGITYISEGLMDYCQKSFSLPEHRSMIWSSGVNIDLFKPVRTRNQSIRFRLMYHGTIADNRGLDKTIEALNLLNIPQIELFLLGSGNGVKRIKRQIAKLNLEKNVTFHPPVAYEDVPGFINESDAGVLPFPSWRGWNTSSPIKLFEYLACCKPVVATRIHAHLSVLKEKDFVAWAAGFSPQDLAEAILKIYEQRQEFMNNSLKAREFVRKEYTWESKANKLQNFIAGKR